MASKRHGKWLIYLLKKSCAHALPNFIFALLILTYCLREAAVFNDGDASWHLAAGDLIRSLGHIPADDPWSFTAGSFRWYNLSWLFDITASWLHAVGGLPLLYALSILIHAGMLALIGAECLRRGAGVIATLIVVMMGGGLLSAALQMRPAILSHVLIVIFYLMCSREASRWLWLLPLLMIVWVNGHGSFTAGFTVIGSFWLEALLRRDMARAKRLFVTGMACGVAIFANPYGWSVFEVIGQRALNSVVTPLIGEWTSTNLKKEPLIVAWLLLFIVSWNGQESRLRFADRLLALFWLMMAMISIRFWGIAVLVAMPYLAQALALFYRRQQWGASIRSSDDSMNADMQKPAVRLSAVFTAALACVFVISPWPRETLLPPVVAPASAMYYPKAAVNYINVHYPARRFLNHYDLGGGMVYIGRGQPKVFVDGRAGMAYSETILADYLAFMEYCALDDRAREIAERYAIDGVVLPVQEEYGKHLACWDTHPDYKEVYRDDVAVIYLRRDE